MRCKIRQNGTSKDTVTTNTSKRLDQIRATVKANKVRVKDD